MPIEFEDATLLVPQNQITLVRDGIPTNFLIWRRTGTDISEGSKASSDDTPVVLLYLTPAPDDIEDYVYNERGKRGEQLDIESLEADAREFMIPDNCFAKIAIAEVDSPEFDVYDLIKIELFNSSSGAVGLIPKLIDYIKEENLDDLLPFIDQLRGGIGELRKFLSGRPLITYSLTIRGFTVHDEPNKIRDPKRDEAVGFLRNFFYLLLNREVHFGLSCAFTPSYIAGCMNVFAYNQEDPDHMAFYEWFNTDKRDFSRDKLELGWREWEEYWHDFIASH